MSARHVDHLDALAQLAGQNARVAREVVLPDVPDDVVRATRVFGSAIRVAIVRTLLAGPTAQQEAVRALGISYSTFRQNVEELVAAGAVRVINPERRVGGRPVTYAADDEEIRRLGSTLLGWATVPEPVEPAEDDQPDDQIRDTPDEISN